MLLEGLYGDRLAKLFPALDQARTLVVKSVNHGAFGATRMTYPGVCPERSDPTAPDEAFALCLRLKNQKARIWLDGEASDKSGLEGETSIYDLRSEILLRFQDPIDILFMYMPRRSLIEIAEQEGATGVDFSIEAGKSFVDPVMAHLGGCLLPAIESPSQANGLFVEHLAMAVQTHFLARYVTRSRLPRPCRSGLTGRQLRIAKQAIYENLDGSRSLSSIAQECGLSPSHFARAFAISVGQPPHQWLLEQRVDLARQLLGESSLPIAEIAVQCGFADQSHLTRVFSARTGSSPGRWRRAQNL
jgi:AraC family transcriptional regulator